MVKVLEAGQDPSKMEASNYHSAGGMNDVQTRMWDKLLDGTERSRKTIEKMTKTLEKYDSKDVNMEGKQFEVLRHIKQGIATLNKNGKDTGVLSALKDVVNKLPNHKDESHKDVHNTIEDYEPIVVGTK